MSTLFPDAGTDGASAAIPPFVQDRCEKFLREFLDSLATVPEATKEERIMPAQRFNVAGCTVQIGTMRVTITKQRKS